VRYESLARRLAEVEYIATPTLMIQGAEDRCDEPSGSAKQERFFTGGYRRAVLEGVGHFPHREAPDEVAQAIDRHIRATAVR
jgi:pimeloyl-ACP methyl ester carboxylesterase